MKFRPAQKKVLFMALVLGIFASASWLPADIAALHAIPLKFLGSTVIYIRPTGTKLNMAVRVLRGNDPVTGLKVACQEKLAPEVNPGVYQCLIENCNASPGSRISVTFETKAIPTSLPPLVKPKPLVANARLEPFPTFTQPAMNTHVSLLSITPLNVAWSGGKPPSLLSIFPFTGKDELGDPIFQETVVSGTRIAVPLARFSPGMKYGIYLNSEMNPFVFSETIDPGSRFVLRSSIATYIFTE